MPCEEVADAIVGKWKETLEKAIEMVKNDTVGRYGGARVVYGDTDSMFIRFEGELPLCGSKLCIGEALCRKNKGGGI